MFRTHLVQRCRYGLCSGAIRDLDPRPGVASHFPGKQDARRAAVAAWAVSGIETYDRLLLQAGWSNEEYEQWLGDMFTRTLLPSRTKRSR